MRGAARAMTQGPYELGASGYGVGQRGGRCQVPKEEPVCQAKECEFFAEGCEELLLILGWGRHVLRLRALESCVRGRTVRVQARSTLRT